MIEQLEALKRAARVAASAVAIVVAVSCGGAERDGGGTGPTSTPTIALATTTQLFTANVGSGSPAPQSITITNGGSGTLAGLAAGPVAYGSGQSTGWLATSLSGTSAPATLTLSATVGNLAAGTYTATVPITSSAPGVTNSPLSLTVTFTVTLAGAGPTLNVAGQSVAFLNSPSFSTSLTVQPGSQYLIAVVNTDNSYTAQEDFTLSASFGGASSSRAAPVAPPVSLAKTAEPASALSVPGLPRSRTALRSAFLSHTAMLEENRKTFARMGSPLRAWAKARAQSKGLELPASAAAVVSPSVGTLSKVYVRNSITGGSCTTVDSIGARAVAVGQHVIVLADTNRRTWPDSLRPDSSWYQTFVSEYDALTYPHILNNIGDPLGLDQSLSKLGKISVVITPVLNNFPGNGGSVVAFVNGCDFFPFATSGVDADYSNQTEMFYSWVPGSDGYTVADWEAGLRATAAHESKHIVSYTDRILNNSPVFEEIWLEEGLAQESSEIWERNFNQATWLGHATFIQTVGCEIPLGASVPCDQANSKPYALLASHLPFFWDYLTAENSNSEGLGLDTPSNYGAGWTIARWATDQYAQGIGEAAFIKSLINDPSLSGLANLSAHTGQSVATLLVYWNLATAIFQTPSYTAADVRTTIPSFNFADIFNVGQTKLTCDGTPCGIFTDSGSPVFPIQPIAITAGAFTKTVRGVPGTSASFFLLSGAAAGTETLQLLSGSGGALTPSSGFRVAILRVQ